MDTIILMTLVVIAILIILIIKEYNKIIKLQNKVKSSESGIDIYLNQRFDLIPNLVECVKGYAKHEKQLLENITKQRTEYAKNQNLKKVVSLVAGSLVIALVVSILPGGFLASAAEVSRREAKNVAIDYINDDSAEIVEIDDDGLDEDKPHYKVKIKTDKSEYTLVVDAETAASTTNVYSLLSVLIFTL